MTLTPDSSSPITCKQTPMNTKIKDKILGRMEKYIQSAGLSNAAFARRVEVSAATISQMLNRKWDNISDRIWRKVAQVVGYNTDHWNVAETRNYRLLCTIADDCKEHGLCQAVSFNAGSGKSFSLKHYAMNRMNVYYFECSEHMSPYLFLGKLLQAMGLPEEYHKHERIDSIVNHCHTRDMPLIILDEFDKLRDEVMLLLIELYNRLDGYCGFLICGAPYLKKYIERSAKIDKKGFREIYSRLGRNFHSLVDISRGDVKLICAANGVTSDEDVTQIYNASEGDLRRVRREIERLQIQHQEEPKTHAS